MNHPNKTSQGLKAEGEAAQFFQNRFPHSRLIEKNFRVRAGEIDLIFEDDQTLVFIEVRTRSKAFPVEPIDTITNAKMARINRAIQVYLLKYQGTATQIRIDYLFRVEGSHWTYLRG